MRLQVQGWRKLPQSFAVVNQFQCLELMARNDIELTHLDAPLPPLKMLLVKRPWQPVESLFPAAANAKLAAIPAPDPSKPPDATLRIFFPSDFSAAPHGRTFVFCVTESGPLAKYMIADRRPLTQVLASNDVQLLTPSAWSKQGLISGGVSAERIHVVPHGVDPGIYCPLPRAQRKQLREQFGWKEQFVFLNTSNLYRWKGIELLLKAFAVIVQRYPQARLMLKGSDSIYSSERALKTLAGNLSAREVELITPRLGYSGRTLSFDALANLYQGADALVAPYHSEGFNLPVLEAMACGLPVICTAGGPTDEFVGDGLTLPIRSRKITRKEDNRYQLVPDLDHLIELMAQSIEDRPLRERIHDHAPKHVREHYS